MVCVCVGLGASLLATSAARSAQDVDLHALNWYVHVDLVTPSQDVAYWEDLLGTSIAAANGLVEGAQGPIDTACCSRISGAVSISVFGTPGDGYDVIDSVVEQNSLNGFGGPGSNAYLVDSLTYCGGPGNPVGCAIQPTCTGNGNDDPNLWMAVTVDAFDKDILSQVIAHERGHNACLPHVSTHACQIMRGSVSTPGVGGCFTASECTNFKTGRTTTSSGLECGCLAAGGGPEPDGTTCSDADYGVCSGGLCGESAGDAGVKLVASAHPGSAAIPAPDDALMISALSGDWVDAGQISPTAEDVHGLAYARDAGILYGVVPTSGDDLIVTIDADSGDLIATVGAIANGTAELISMAYHPGATASPVDDRLLMMEISGGLAIVVWIDPASPSVRQQYGALDVGPADAFQGLAYDSQQGKLFAATPILPSGLYEIDLGSCPPSPCLASQIPGGDPLFVFDASLAFAPETGMLYQMGTAFSGGRTFYNVIDPSDGTTPLTFSIDELTPGGLAAVPEPNLATGLVVGCVGLLWAGSRQRNPSGCRRS
jgi:hypothetical protein